ncbi:MAG: pyrroline-5-carboxylate reductase [Gammaproteobacteria bacterium]
MENGCDNNTRQTALSFNSTAIPGNVIAMENHILSIGGGNMGSAIIGGLLAKDYRADRIAVVDPSTQVQTKIADDFGISVQATCREIRDGEIVLLAVKPQIMQPVVKELAQLISTQRPLFISIAAGITTTQLRRWLKADVPIVRVMPNTPSLVGHGAAALFATAEVRDDERRFAESIMSAVGLAQWVDDEALLDVVTALSGSGPAYFFLFMEIMEEVAVELGLERSIARKLTIETAHGAALLAQNSAFAPGELREQVTSPGGTTERALGILNSGDIRGLLREALKGAHSRSNELAIAADTDL